MNERKIKVGALINIRGSLFEKQRLDIVKDACGLVTLSLHGKNVEPKTLDKIKEFINCP